MDIKRVGASGADLGALEWAKGARKTDLHVIACFLIAKQDYGVFLERFAHCAIGSVVGCHVDQIDPAHLRGEPRPQRDESHDRPSPRQRNTIHKSKRVTNWTMRRSPTRLRFPASFFVHHAGITDALDDHDRDEFAEAVILPALPPYAYMKLGGHSEKSGPERPSRREPGCSPLRHETRSHARL